MSSWHLYLIRTRLGTLYTGITTDVSRRFAEHTAGNNGAKYLKSKGPLKLVYQLEVGSQGLALKLEHRVKQLSKAKKEQIVMSWPEREELFKMTCLDVERHL
ncbi:MAG: GIY-YIG nuclease family protein [Thermosynechococcaceae cyanobacterium]